jgi:L-fuconolactonase
MVKMQLNLYAEHSDSLFLSFMETQHIDAHQHFWQYSPAKHTWMSEEMGALKTDFQPLDLLPHLQNCALHGSVAVQADQSEDENTFLLNLATEYEVIKGIVGWVDLQADDIEERLAHYQQFPKMKGFRHVLHDEAQRDFMLRPAFMRGVSKLNKYSYTYDILIFTDQLPFTLKFIEAFPDQRFVIDHIAKPLIKQQIVGAWREDMAKIAAHENVYCKISGLVTEADWKNWKTEDFKVYLDIVVNLFGPDRIMYGSDWPVCQLAASYQAQYNLVKTYFSSFGPTEQAKFFGKNATTFYQL